MEVRQVRNQEIKLIKIDEPSANIKYIGRSSSMRGLDSENCWQILREYKNGDVIESTYANMGEYNCSWNNRASYFSAAIPDDSNSVTGSITVQGIAGSGRVTEVVVNSTTWTALPASPLVGRKALSIQNPSATEVKINYSNSVPGYAGMVVLPNGGERGYSVDSSVVIYGKSVAGSVTLNVEEAG